MSGGAVRAATPAGDGTDSIGAVASGAPARGWDRLLEVDRRHVWHPYGPMPAATSPLPVATEGVRLRLADGRELRVNVDPMDGCRCQRRGGPIEVIRPGDRVFFEPGEDHWHGAAQPLHDPPRHARSRRPGQPRHLGRARHRRGIQRRARG